MKRKSALLIVAVLIINIFFSLNVFSYYDTNNTNVEKAVEFLSRLEIMQEKDDESFGAEDYVTRAEACDAVVKLMNKTPAQSTSVMFSDISESYWAYDSIAYLADMGLVAGYGGNFEPERNISYNEFLTILVKLLGYEAFANELGGYPNGYLNIAEKAKLTKNTSGAFGEKAMNRADMAVICFNALNTAVSEIDGFEGDGIVMKSGRTVLQMYWDIYKTDGIINGVWGISEEKLNSYEILVDGDVYKTEDMSLHDKLGYYTEMYYKEEEKGADKTVVYADFRKYNNVYEPDAKDIVEASDYKLIYEDGKRNKTIKLSRSIDVILNGVFISAWDDFSIFDINSGSIRLIDNNNDNIAEYAIIRSIEVLTVNKVDLRESVIYDDTNRQNKIKLDENAGYIRIRNSSGADITFDSIQKYDVLDVVKTDGIYYDIVVESEKISGRLNSANAEKEILNIDGEEYYMSSEFFKSSDYTFIKAGETYTFLLDARGYVSGIQKNTDSEIIPGCLISLREYDDNIDEARARFKLYNISSGETEVLYSAKKVTIDGYKCKTYSEIYERLNADTHATKPRGINQVVLYKVNSDNEVCYMDTSEKTTKESSETLSRSYEKKQRVYRSAYNCFNMTFLVSSSTLFASFSANETDENKMYEKGKLSDYITDYYTCEAYRYGKFNGYESILLNILEKDTDLISSSKLLGMVSEIYGCINDDDEVGYMITIAQKGGIVSKFMEESDFERCKGVKRGDTVRYTEKQGRIDNIEAVYSYEGKNDIMWSESSRASSDGKSTYTFRYVYDVYDNVIAFSENIGDKNTVSYLIPSKSAAVIYDDELKEAETVDEKNVRGYVSDGYGCSRAIIQWKSNEPVSIAIYR